MTRRLKSVARIALPVVSLVMAASCSAGAHGSSDDLAHRGYITRPALNGHVWLMPNLTGGTAGWCMAISDHSGRRSSSGCGVEVTSTGPVFAHTCTSSGTTSTYYALTRSEVASLVVDGGKAIATTGSTVLPDGLRAAVVEVLGPASPLRERLEHPCPSVRALDGHGQLIRRKGARGTPLAVNLPREEWEAPAHPARGACGLTASRLPAETVAFKGAVATSIRATQGLIGQAFISCVGTTYLYRDEHHLTSAVLLDAARPGATPPALPGMRHVPGRKGMFEARAAQGVLVARRIAGAWLVVEEQDRIGLGVPVELLEDLRATVQL